MIQRVKRTHSLWRCLNLWSYVWSGHKHAAMCMLWPYFLVLTLDRTVQKMQISYSCMYILAFGLIKIYFYSCLPLIWSILLLCSFSLFYIKVISENLCRQYSASVIYDSCQFLSLSLSLLVGANTCVSVWLVFSTVLS